MDFTDHLQRLDDSLACGICSGLFDTPLLLRTCGHSFCSSCIRKSIEFQEKNGSAYCPTCRVGCDARDLVGNVVLRDVSERYSRVVQSLKAHAEKDREPSKMRTRGSKLRSKKVMPAAVTATEISLVSQDDDVVVMDDGDSDDDGMDSGEEYVPTQEQDEKTERQKQQGSSFMECPICKKNVHHMYLNSHIDECLVNGNAETLRNTADGHADGSSAQDSWKPLQVPPKILGNFANDKTIKSSLKKYGLSCEGKKSELLERYSSFRTEVEIANDKREVTTYEKIAFRVGKKQRYKAAATLLKTSVSNVGALPVKRKAGNHEHQVNEEDIANGQWSHPRDILVPENASFAELIRTTKLRDTLRKKLQQGNGSPNSPLKSVQPVDVDDQFDLQVQQDENPQMVELFHHTDGESDECSSETENMILTEDDDGLLHEAVEQADDILVSLNGFLLAWFILGVIYSLGTHVLSLFKTPAQKASDNNAFEESKDRSPKSTFDELKRGCVRKKPEPLRRYGLDADELSASVLYPGEGEDLDGEEDLTTRELRRLQNTRSFKEWCVQNKMNSSALQDQFSRIHVYKKLKELHPESFWALCSPASLVAIDVVDPSIIASIAEYILSRCIDLTSIWMLFRCVYPNALAYTHPRCLTAYSLFLVFVLRHWIRGRSSASIFFSSWYETLHLSEQYFTSSGLIRTFLAQVLENIFVIGSLGFGALISLYGRCFSESMQSIGERIAGVKLIVEKKRSLAAASSAATK